MTQGDYGAALNLPPHGARERPIRLVLVEDHTVLRDGLKALLELHADVVSVGEFGCVQSSVDGIRRLQPDVVVTDLALPGGSGIGLISDMKHISPQSRKLVLTMNDGQDHIRAALSAGADGYVLKDATSGELLRGIRAVSTGERFLCSATASKVLASYLSGDKPPPTPPTTTASITAREREVLTGIAQGQSNKVIGRALGLSFKTVEKHRSNLMRKLQLHNAAAITMYAIRNGLVGDDPPVDRVALESPTRRRGGLCQP
jgi:DNA-binding NarL/FixJ family response regulator